MKKTFYLLGLIMLSLCGCTSSNNSNNNNISGSENQTPTTIDSFNKKIETQKGNYQIDYLSVESKKIVVGGLFYYTENVNSFSLYYEITNTNDTAMVFEECVLLSSSSIVELCKETYCYYSFNLTDEIINHRSDNAEDFSHFDVLYCDFGMGGYIMENANEDYQSDYQSCFHCYLAPNVSCFENGYYHS